MARELVTCDAFLPGGRGRVARGAYRAYYRDRMESVPATFWPYAAGLAGLLIGAIWLRRVTGGEPEPQSFRATSGPQRDYLPVVGIVAAAALMALIVLLLQVVPR